MTDSAAIGTLDSNQHTHHRVIDAIDAWAIKAGDRINPILIKETRQALKSRQFLVTFSTLLVAALGWTIIGSLSMMPQIYTTPSAPRLLIGYYVLLAIPMLLIVPLAAYRSLEAEIDDGTLELLSITTLSPWQIVLGKLASACLQILLYLVTLFPCVAYAYTLRGIDLPTLGLIMAALIVTALTLTVVALSLAPVARGRTGRISTLLVVMAVLLLAQYLIGFGVVSMILYGNPVPIVLAGYLLFAFTATSAVVCHLLLTTTAALLTPESENRSTPIRWSILALTITLVTMAAFGIESAGSGRDANEVAMATFSLAVILLAGLWTVSGAMFSAESETLTPRIRRELPGNFVSRMLLTFFTPGPATGLVFSMLMIAVVSGAVLFAIETIANNGAVGLANRDRRLLWDWTIIYSSYLVMFLVAVRWIVAVVRIKNNPRVEIGLAALIVVAVLSALIPYSVGLHWNDYRPYSYSYWQITNWFWTLGLTTSGSLPRDVIPVLVLGAVAAFLLALASVGTRALPMRTAMPAAVMEELAKTRQRSKSTS
ncbi:MAG: ABC transporter permease [Planctomycetota bacterium]